jgi:hypothetical protein
VVDLAPLFLSIAAVVSAAIPHFDRPVLSIAVAANHRLLDFEAAVSLSDYPIVSNVAAVLEAIPHFDHPILAIEAPGNLLWQEDHPFLQFDRAGNQLLQIDVEGNANVLHLEVAVLDFQ